MIIDISPALSEQTAVWPGDQTLSRTLQMQLENGDSVELSSLLTTVHIGAHADAPSHFARGAEAIDQLDLSPYLGPCFVCEVKGVSLIHADHLKEAVASRCQRILVKTDSFPNPNEFNKDFTAFSQEAVSFAGENGVKLLGIDTPSVDPFDSKSLEAHQQLLAYGIRNLEGLSLAHVEVGIYELIALPLKLVGYDASPVRAVLRKSN